MGLDAEAIFNRDQKRSKIFNEFKKVSKECKLLTGSVDGGLYSGYLSVSSCVWAFHSAILF